MSETTASPSEESQESRDRGSSWRDYIPLLVLVALTALAASARQLATVDVGMAPWMHDFMGFFLVVFAMFKLFDLPGFADGFQMYDLLAKRARPYALLYPFLELGLGLAYLARFYPAATYAVTIVLMTFGALGVFTALKKGLDINCACMGTTLNVPLSTVAVVEDVGMAAMAAMLLVMAVA